MQHDFQIITFYEFREMPAGGLDDICDRLRVAMGKFSIKGTIILAQEGINSTVCGVPTDITRFVTLVEAILNTKVTYKSSFHEHMPFRRIDVKIKPEIVTLKTPVDISLSKGTHVKPHDWNDLVSDPQTIVLDARNEYEYLSGTFQRALNTGTAKFSELPAFIAENLDPTSHRRIAMFCTGGIRCEKLAPYLKQLGFQEVYQLEGGILKYLEQIPPKESLWEGECFVFDDRVTVDDKLKKGKRTDLSLSKTAD